MAETKAENPPSSDEETLIAHAIWHTNTTVFDKREIANKLANVLAVGNPEDFVRMASDPVYPPNGPWAEDSEVIVDALAANAPAPQEQSSSSKAKKD